MTAAFFHNCVGDDAGTDVIFKSDTVTWVSADYKSLNVQLNKYYYRENNFHVNAEKYKVIWGNK